MDRHQVGWRDPRTLKKALTTGDPKDLGLLIHEWRAFGRQKEIQTTDATFIKRLDFPLADQSAEVETSPTGFVYFVRNGDLLNIGITENMLRRLRELAGLVSFSDALFEGGMALLLESFG